MKTGVEKSSSFKNLIVQKIYAVDKKKKNKNELN